MKTTEKRKLSEAHAPSIDFAYNNIREILEKARLTAIRAVNSAMVFAYWEIGRVIVEEEQKGKERAAYGANLLKQLSVRLTKEFGKGFDESNLRCMRLFYSLFPIRGALRHELSWTHYRLLIRVESDDSRRFYLNETINSKWSTRELERQINSLLYERLVSSKNKEKVKEDNSPIGLILCSDKNEVMVKYTLLPDSKSIFASKYKLYLPTEEDLKRELRKEQYSLWRTL